MRDELAGRVLAEVIEWSDEEQARWIGDLQRLAVLKFDHYEGFAVGTRFFESLARWLPQFAEQTLRRRLIQFILSELIFISRDEFGHLIACAYPDFIKPFLMSQVAHDLDLPDWAATRVVESEEFRSLRRRTLFLGLSDGARMDRLRRLSPELSHEQFWPALELGLATQGVMVAKLAEALEKLRLPGDPTFSCVVFVDDFYGSGTSLLHRTKEGGWGGKLAKAAEYLERLKDANPRVMVAEPAVLVVIYVASTQAAAHITDQLSAFAPAWELRIIQQLPVDIRVTDEELVTTAEWFFDPILIDEHKRGAIPLGYEGCALPVVLHHNTPNNSVSFLWADSTGRVGGLQRRALFPRYERHHVDRP